MTPASDLHISEHAFQRGRERLGLNRKATERMACRAFAAGLRHEDTFGALRQYLGMVASTRGTADNLRVHGEAVWVFCSHTLVTVLQLPHELRKAAHATRRAQRSAVAEVAAP
ncbi:hypothetical protein [Hyalangium versicolor]|uniref:hypothetical protein n=1 Tax=Hyalangium versicolor TaxID=2861190 RepID=UPI001CCB9464|nr:hypothetical protein [Hyalangium versicolor]